VRSGPRHYPDRSGHRTGDPTWDPRRARPGQRDEDPVTTFASAITCIDGRVLAPLIDWASETFGVEAVDIVTEPGVDGCLPDRIEDLTRRLSPSLTAHGSHDVVLAGHEDCAGNPVSADEHRSCLALSAAALSEALGPDVSVVPVYLHLDGTVDVLDEHATARREGLAS
jgi:hypothetical protein